MVNTTTTIQKIKARHLVQPFSWKVLADVTSKPTTTP